MKPEFDFVHTEDEPDPRPISGSERMLAFVLVYSAVMLIALIILGVFLSGAGAVESGDFEMQEIDPGIYLDLNDGTVWHCPNEGDECVEIEYELGEEE